MGGKKYTRVKNILPKFLIICFSLSIASKVKMKIYTTSYNGITKIASPRLMNFDAKTLKLHLMDRPADQPKSHNQSFESQDYNLIVSMEYSAMVELLVLAPEIRVQIQVRINILLHSNEFL